MVSASKSELHILSNVLVVHCAPIVPVHARVSVSACVYVCASACLCVCARECVCVLERIPLTCEFCAALLCPPHTQLAAGTT